MKKLNEFIEKVGMDKVAHFFGIALVALIVSLVFTKANPGEPAATYAACGFIGGVIVLSPRRLSISSRATTSRISACPTSQPVRQALS